MSKIRNIYYMYINKKKGNCYIQIRDLNVLDHVSVISFTYIFHSFAASKFPSILSDKLGISERPKLIRKMFCLVEEFYNKNV